MWHKNTQIHSMQFYTVGVNYKKADVSVRSRFSLNTQQKESLLQAAANKSLDLMLISTCNRTEVYAFAPNPHILIDLLCKYSKGNQELFNQIGFILQDEPALRYVLRVAAGLESQILGDFEIIGQFKREALLAKKNKTLSPVLERFANEALKLSKNIKNQTKLSDGSASVSYHAVRYIRDNVPQFQSKKVLLYGLGEIGKNTCENLMKHTENKKVVLINRTEAKAEQIAFKYHIESKSIEDLPNEIAQSDVIIVSTSADEATIKLSDIPKNKALTIIDLSVPSNVDEKIEELPNVNVVHIDQLSKMIDKTLQNRQLEIPKAEKMLEDTLNEFQVWLNGRQYVPAIANFKASLEKIFEKEWKGDGPCAPTCAISAQVQHLNTKFIQNITNRYASFIMQNETEADECISIMSKVFKA